MNDEQLRTIGKAASALRFTANNWEGLTEAAQQEMLAVADALTEIENERRSHVRRRKTEITGHD